MHTRAPVRSSEKYGKPRGTISWMEHVLAFNAYEQGRAAYPQPFALIKIKTPERYAALGGFTYGQLVDLLGCEPLTWEAEGADDVERR